MLKAGALYFAIIMAFFIALVSASLLMLAAHYRSAYLKELRFNRLLLNLESGIEMVLADQEFKTGKQVVDLYGEESDSVEVEKRTWGLFNVAVLKTFIARDTLKHSFLIGKADSTDQRVLYLADEDRPISVSGDTRITGDAALPKSGIKQSYVDGRAYSGKELIKGKISDSERTLPAPDEERIKQISENLERDVSALRVLPLKDLVVSFFDSVKVFKLNPGQKISQHLSGNIILFSDTTIVLTAHSKLEGIQIYAPYIKIEDGFSGSCQLFVRDSLRVGSGVRFAYPSCLAVIKTPSSSGLPKISCGADLKFAGIMFSYEQQRSPLQTLISLGKNTHFTGEIYAAGILKIEKGLKLKGKISCNRFMMQTPQTLYENFLVDVEFNRKARSKYYLSAMIFKNNTGTNRILKWLN